MNVFNIINMIKNSFNKEAVSLKPYRQPDVGPEDMDKPYNSYVPPVAGGGSSPVGDVKNKQVSPGVANSPASNPSSIIQKQDTIAKTVPQFLQMYKILFNKKVTDFSSRSPVSNYQIIEEIFTPFLTEQRDALEGNYDLPNWENRFEALKLFEDSFNKEIQTYKEGEPSEEALNSNRKQYPDLSENEIRNLIDRNISAFKQGMGGRSEALKQVSSLPEIVQNDNNNRLFEIIKKEYEGSIGQSELSDGDRKELVRIFMDSYLDVSKARNPQEKKKIESRLMALMPDTEEDSFSIPEEDDFGRKPKKKKNPNKRRNEIDDILDAPRGDFSEEDAFASSLRKIKEATKPISVINPFDFIEQELFQPDSFNKELFLSFFLEKDNIGLIPVQDFADPEELAYIRQKAGTFDSRAMGLVQQHSKDLANVLKEIMTNPGNPSHDKFFSWVLNEIRRFGIRKQGPRNTTQESSAVDSEGKPMGGTLTSPAAGFATEFRLPLSKDVMFDEGLKNSGPQVTAGKVINLETIDSFNQNVTKFLGFISDMLGNMESAYQSSSDKDLKKTILEKHVYWGRVKKSCEETAKRITEGVHRTGKNPSDKRELAILNQNWDEFFKKEYFKDYGWNMDDSPDIYSAVNLAIQDQLLVSPSGGFIQDPNEAYEELFGGIDWSDRGAANKVLNRSRGKIPLLKDLIINSDLISKYGRDTLISFLDVIGIPPDSVSIGALLAKNNRGSFENKMNYLSELSRKGIITKGDDEIENMSPKEISDLFSTVRSHLEMIYSNKGDLKKMLGDPKVTEVGDQELSQLAADAGFPEIKSKEDYRKAKNDAKTAIVSKFYQTNFGKYCVEKISDIEMLEVYVERAIRESQNNPQFLQSNGFENKNEFLSAIGVEPLNIAKSVEEMPQRRLFQISNKYYNKMYVAYRKGLLSKGLLDKNKEKTVEEVVNSIIDLPSVEPIPMLNQLSDALFFAEALDSQSTEKQASSVFDMIRKIAAQKKENQALLLSNRLSRFNVDTSGVDEILSKIRNGRK